VVAARGVLQQQQHRRLELLEGLAPADEALLLFIVGGDVAAVDDHRGGPDRRRGAAGLREQLARRDADAVVAGGDVDAIGRVHVFAHRRGGQVGRVRARRRDPPALRVAHEELDAVRAPLAGLVERGLAAEMDADLDHPRTLAAGPTT
jgi:hypothetical protein